MSRPVYLSALREKNLKEGAPYPNLVKREKCFAMFTRVTNGINLLKSLDRVSVLVLVDPVNQIKSMSTGSSEHRRAELNWLPLIEEVDSVISDAVIDRRCREWPPPKREACMRSVSKCSEKFSKQFKHHNQGTIMPLPNLKKQCIAKAKSTGVRCHNPAAYGCKTCRLHGARKNIISGKDHHWYKHGYRSKDGIEKAREIQQLLRVYEAIGHDLGFMHGKRTPGRKP